MLRIGSKVGSEQYPPNGLLGYAIAAEEAGFDLVKASDHFHPWSNDGQAAQAEWWRDAAQLRASA
jgi:coenzyme F420-dependent glucose-6-phosphate dehydrogenase